MAQQSKGKRFAATIPRYWPATHPTLAGVEKDRKELITFLTDRFSEGEGQPELGQAAGDDGSDGEEDHYRVRPAAAAAAAGGGYRHYQVECNIGVDKPAVRASTLQGEFAGTIAGGHWRGRVKVEGNPRAFTGYAVKPDTRDGEPFTWGQGADEEDEPLDIVGKVPRAWQQVIIDSGRHICLDDRGVNIIYDPRTSIGKTFVRKYMRYHKLGCVIPQMDKFEDMMAIVLHKRGAKCYLIDCPKSMDPDKTKGFWSGIESLKDGYAFDKRFKFRDVQMNSPHVWVFTNTFPPRHAMAANRYHIWMINSLERLVPWTAEREENIRAYWEDHAPAVTSFSQHIAKRAARPDISDVPYVKRVRTDVTAVEDEHDHKAAGGGRPMIDRLIRPVRDLAGAIGIRALPPLRHDWCGEAKREATDHRLCWGDDLCTGSCHAPCLGATSASSTIAGGDPYTAASATTSASTSPPAPTAVESSTTRPLVAPSDAVTANRS